MTRRSKLPNTSGIYLIRNLMKPIDFYVGSATNLRVRKNKHWARLRHNVHEAFFLQNAFNKYGEDSFSFEILEVMEVTYEPSRRAEAGYYETYIRNLWAREQHHMDVLNPCYNYLSTAGTNLGAIKPGSKSNTYGIWWNNLRQCWVVRYGNQSRGQFNDLDEAKLHLEKVKHDPTTPNPPDDRSAVVKSDEEIAKLRARMIGNDYTKGHVFGPMPEETKRKISVTKTGVLLGPQPESQKRNNSIAQKGKPRDWQKGKSSKPSKSGEYGIGWRADLNKWMVRIENKKYGAFDNLEEAIKRRDEVLAMLAKRKNSQ